MKINWTLKNAGGRVLESLPPVIQIIVAALASYSFAHFVLGHQNPLLAVTVTITTLGFTRDARPRRVMETALGIVTGLFASELLVQWFGQGVWQLAVTLFLCLLGARFVTQSASFALTVGIQAMFIQLLPLPVGGIWVRPLDGVVAAVTSLLVTVLVPRNPKGLAQKDASALFNVFLESLSALRTALRDVDVKKADDTLNKVRRTQPLVDNWRMSLDSAVAISRISPFLKKERYDLNAQLRLMRGMDLATRNLRVIVRRVDFLIRDGEKRPYLADLIEQIHDATSLLSKATENEEYLYEARAGYVEVIHQLDPKKFGIADQLREASVLLLLRPMLVDLLCATGMSEDDARDELPAV
ncbi:MAG: hypothetical protein RLY83_113 [Actinomycetota bacterium]|jgi:uncharacterized membrane protein YgaE (UPF0421/DUF939 family)